MYIPTKTGRGRKEQDILQLMTFDGLSNLPELEYGNRLDQNLRVFSFVSIIEATNNFSPENKLGEGGYGPVYKVQLDVGKCRGIFLFVLSTSLDNFLTMIKILL